MRILLDEKALTVPEGASLFSVRDRFKPGADIVVLNGAIVKDDRTLSPGDSVCLIRRGETPSRSELEALLVARHTPGVHAVAKRAAVGIAGLGGLGSTVAVALVRTGIGKLVLADFDVVEPSNLNRQQYTVEQIGLYKTDALREVLGKINPYVEIETHCVRLDDRNVPEVFGRVDVMVEAFDAVAAKAMLVRSFRKACPGVPLVTASGLAGYGPSNRIRTRRVLPNLYLVGDEESEARPGVGLMAPRVGIAASHQANAVLRLLLGEPVGDDEPLKPA
ncbi:MAG: sulfur carrier protein ThiS adenylyltransferase ThiF [Kiritimatiellaeota bacterium]|nr:sulfur carrier protein ThiS adenylyltransferase ThiF [Kiritimatiellota bacterium]